MLIKNIKIVLNLNLHKVFMVRNLIKICYQRKVFNIKILTEIDFNIIL